MDSLMRLKLRPSLKNRPYRTLVLRRNLMKQKTPWFLSVLLISALLLPGCEKKEDDKTTTTLALFGILLGGGGDCSVAFPGKSPVSINRTKTTKGSTSNVVWGRIPFVNHPIAIVEVLNATAGNTVTFTGVDSIDNPNESGDQATIYENTDCPLATSDLTNSSQFSTTTRGSAGPFVYTNVTGGSYYFLLYLIGGNPPAATVQYSP